MLADRSSCELDAVALPVYPDKREVAGAAADVAHQHGLTVEEQLL